MREVKVRLHSDIAIGDTDPRLFGAFVEHLGRCVYGGIFEPTHPSADGRGFRQDVLALVRQLNPTIIVATAVMTQAHARSVLDGW